MAGCGCGGSAGSANLNGQTLGYRAYLPNGEIIPPLADPPYAHAAEAMVHTTLAAGGTVRRVVKGQVEPGSAPASA